MIRRNRRSLSTRSISLTLPVLLITIGVCRAAPIFGDKHQLRQPDGSLVDVRIWGDEYHQIVESLDGYTLVRDSVTGVICYARLSGDRRQLVSTGQEVGKSSPATTGLAKHLRVLPEAVKATAATTRLLLNPTTEVPAIQAADNGEPLPAATSTGNVQGICLIVDFSDDPGTIAPSEVANYCNQVGYSGYGNNGSVRDYFYDVSIGRLTYTNYVPTQYHRALYTKAYYDDPNVSYGTRARELITEALNALDASGFDFSQYDSDDDGKIDAVNCLYAGTTTSGWAEGLWPHCGGITWSADGVSTSRYQITNMGSSLRLSTFCHENGHMICGWPDLYDYDHDSSGVGTFCLMCSSGSTTNPVQPCAYLRYIAGWTDTTLLTSLQTNLPLTTGTNAIYKYAHPTVSTEYYLIENRQKTGRDAALPTSGLALWHIDVNGSNNNQQMTPASHYRVTLVQADGRWDLENQVNYGDSTDLWKAPTYVTCGPATNPNTNWWNGAASDLAITEISASGATMTFTFGMPEIVLSTTTIEHNILPGETVDNDSFTIASSESAFPLDYNIEYDPAWMTVSPTSGSSSGEADPIAITYSNDVISAWPKGTYSAIITINAPNAVNHPQSLIVRVVVETVKPDFDGDMDVDQEDFAHLQACFSGSGVVQSNPACQDASLDHDSDIDQQDFLIFRNCLSGPGAAVDLNCYTH